MKVIFKILGLAVVEIILFWLFSQSADPSVSIGLVFLVPATFAISLMIAIFIFFLKKSVTDWFKVFLVNSLLAPLIIYYTFSTGIKNNQRDKFEEWRFVKEDTTFAITVSKIEKKFDITFSISSGSADLLLSGNVKKNQNGYILTTDLKPMFIRNNYLFGFNSSSDSIQLAVVSK